MYVSSGMQAMGELSTNQKILVEDAKIVVVQARDILNNPKMQSCPAAAALIPQMQQARESLDTLLRFDVDLSDVAKISEARDKVTWLYRQMSNALAACQGKAAPYPAGGGTAGQAGPGSTQAQILAWQEFLVSKGCKPGTCDGLWGPNTAAATAAYNAGKCSGVPGKCVYPSGAGGKVAPPSPITPPPAPPGPGAPPETRGEVTKQFISGIPNSALVVGGLAIAVLGVAVVVKKRGMPDLGAFSARGRGRDEYEDYGPRTRTRTAPMSRTRRSAATTRRSATTRRRGR